MGLWDERKMRCEVCGWDFGKLPDFYTVKHIRNPTINRESHHHILHDSAILEQWGRSYLPDLYPLLRVSEKVKQKALEQEAERKRELELALKNPELFAYILLRSPMLEGA